MLPVIPKDVRLFDVTQVDPVRAKTQREYGMAA